MFLASNRSTIFSPTFITLLVARGLAPAAHGIIQENYLRVNLYGRPPSRTPRKQAPNVEFALSFSPDFPPNVSVKSGIIYDTAASLAGVKCPSRKWYVPISSCTDYIFRTRECVDLPVERQGDYRILSYLLDTIEAPGARRDQHSTPR